MSRKCVICDAPLDFPSCDTMDDVCSEECGEIYRQIPLIHAFYDYPQVEFFGGIHRDNVMFEIPNKDNTKIRLLKPH